MVDISSACWRQAFIGTGCAAVLLEYEEIHRTCIDPLWSSIDAIVVSITDYHAVTRYVTEAAIGRYQAQEAMRHSLGDKDGRSP